MNEQFISCKTITYGRVSMLEEAVESFLRQDYPADKCELVIVNDYPKQRLHFDDPRIKIINHPVTFNTIGAKENYATDHCKGDIIIQWDDDDIALPNHLQNVNKYFIPGTALMQWHRAIYMDMPHIKSITGVGNSGIVFSKNAWKEINGHPNENAGYDMTFVFALRAAFPNNIIFAAPPDDEVSWIYCWGGRGYHMSGMGTDDNTRPDVIIRHSAYVEEQRKRGMIPTGDVPLHPHWNFDYTEMLKRYVQDKSIHSQP